MANKTHAKYTIAICDGNTCHVRKSKKIARSVLKELGLSEEKTTTDDRMFSVVLTPCMEVCGPGPMMKINDEMHDHVTPESAVALVKGLKG